MPFAENIKRLRIERGMSQKELAAIVGLSDKAVSTWENEGKLPRMGVIERLSAHFNITKSELLDLDNSQLQNAAKLRDPDDQHSIDRINRMRKAGLSEERIDKVIAFAIECQRK
jgi:transcriptional regulator with XRE-family HTH domain